MTDQQRINDALRSAAFIYSFDFMIEHEGGTNFHIYDRGGLTKFGICQKQYPNLDIANLTLDEACRIYAHDYWNKNQCYRFERPVGMAMFDSGVNCGQMSGAIWLQKALNAMGAGLVVDGLIGQKTVYASTGRNSYAIAAKLMAHRLKRYYRLTGNHPEQITFIRGWINRVANLQLAL